jgi:hypothetical protein
MTDSLSTPPGAATSPDSPPDSATAGGVPAIPTAPAGAFSDRLVAAPDYFGAGQHIAPEYARGYEYMAQIFAGTGVRSEISIQGLDVIDQMMDLESLPEQKAQHAYDVTKFRNDFKAEDQAALTYFLNQMAAKGARQSEVNAFLTLYTDAQRSKAKHAAMNAGKTDLQRKATNHMSLDEIRQVMKNERPRYVRDVAMQERYRALLLRGGK